MNKTPALLPPTEARVTTPTQLLDAAERLFAERGIDSVSIREIVRASGQGNLSAAHYHFGSREALVAALVERRMHMINALRHRRLDELAASGQAGSVSAIIHATVGVLAEVVKAQPWGPDYVCITAAANFNAKMQLNRLVDPLSVSGLLRCVDMVRLLLPDLPAQVFRERMRIVNNETAYSIARWVQAHGAVTTANSRRFDAMVRNLADFLAAGVVAAHEVQPPRRARPLAAPSLASTRKTRDSVRPGARSLDLATSLP